MLVSLLVSVLTSLPVSPVVSLRKVVSSDIVTAVIVKNGVGFGVINCVGSVEIDIVGASSGVVVGVGKLPVVVCGTGVSCVGGGAVVVVVDVELCIVGTSYQIIVMKEENNTRIFFYEIENDRLRL